MDHLTHLGAKQDQCQVFTATLSGAEATFAYSNTLILSNKVFQMQRSIGSVCITIRLINSESTNFTSLGLFWDYLI